MKTKVTTDQQYLDELKRLEKEEEKRKTEERKEKDTAKKTTKAKTTTKAKKVKSTPDNYDDDDYTNRQQEEWVVTMKIATMMNQTKNL